MGKPALNPKLVIVPLVEAVLLLLQGEGLRASDTSRRSAFSTGLIRFGRIFCSGGIWDIGGLR